MKKILVALLALTFVVTAMASMGEKNTIIIYSCLEQFRANVLQAQLNEEFPDLNVRVMYVSTAKVASKIDAEKTGTDADIVVGLDNAYVEMIKDNFADVSMYSHLDYIPDFKNMDPKYLILERQAGSIVVNNEVLAKYNLPMPQTYEDLLDPMYKGLIAMPDPKSSGTGYFFYKGLVNVWGEEKTLDYFDQLYANIKQFTESGSGPIKLLIQGEVAIGFALTFQAVDEMNNGNDFLILEPEFGSPYSLTGASIVKGKRDRTGVEEVFDFIVNDFMVYDKEYFSPGQVLKEQENKLENYPTDFSYGDMTGIEDVSEQERLLASLAPSHGQSAGRPLAILLVAHPYVAHDPCFGGQIAELLDGMGCVVAFADECDHDEALRASFDFSETLPWLVNRELVGAITLLHDRIDGIVLASAFPCGPDSMTDDAILRCIQGKPILNLTIDAQSGTAGLETRVESFVDILRYQQKGGYAR